MLSKYKKLEDFEGFLVDPENETIRFACCDCGLVHDIGIAIEEDKVGLVFVRRNRHTAQLRRYSYGDLQKPLKTDKFKIVENNAK